MKAGLECDICDGHIALAQQTFGLLDAIVDEIVHRRLVHDVFERADTLACADIRVRGNIGDGDLFAVMLVDKAEYILHAALQRWRRCFTGAFLHFNLAHECQPSLRKQTAHLEFGVFLTVRLRQPVQDGEKFLAALGVLADDEDFDTQVLEHWIEVLGLEHTAVVSGQ